jgi:hypothetical protein
MNFILEKIINAENKNSFWINGGPETSFKILDNGKYEFDGFQAFANAPIQNPLFFTNNIEYAAKYAEENEEKKIKSMLGLVKIKDL